MDTGFLLGVLLVVVNGAICLSLPVILAATQRKSKQVNDISTASSSLKSSKMVSQEAN